MGYHATEHTLDRSGSRLHYWLAGPAAAPLVVLAHGMTLDHRMFEQQMPVLADTYRVLAWDMRGHGRSQPAGDTFTIDLLVAGQYVKRDYFEAKLDGFTKAIFTKLDRIEDKLDAKADKP